jgi:hypothetical protein
MSLQSPRTLLTERDKGRYIDFINQSLAKKYDINIDYILNEVISDLTKKKCNSIK